MGYAVRTLPSSEWQMDAPIMSMVLAKAMEAGAGVTPASFSGGESMRYELLDDMLQTVTLTAEDCTIWRALPKISVNSTVDWFVRRTGFGGDWGDTAAESDNPTTQMADLNRAYAIAKFYRTRREVSDVAAKVNMIMNPMREEEEAGTIALLQRLNRDIYFGDSTLFPTRITGIIPTQVSGTYNVPTFDQSGMVLSSRTDFEMIAAMVRNNGGRATNAFANPLIQADLSNAYASAERIQVMIDQDRAAKKYVGATIGGVNTSQGLILFEGDPFLSHPAYLPSEHATGNVLGGQPPNQAVGPVPPGAPATVTGVAAGTDGNATNFPTGTYYYRVTAVLERMNSTTQVPEGGQSASTASAVISVTGGQHVTLSIADPVSGSAPSGYYIWRSAKNAASADDCRYLWYVARTGATTSFVDKGTWVPGCTQIVFLDLRQGAGARSIRWSQLLPMSKKALAELGPTQPFLMSLWGALRFAAPEWSGLVKNVLPQAVHTGYAGLPAWTPI
jgi:hypothetical protein